MNDELVTLSHVWHLSQVDFATFEQVSQAQGCRDSFLQSPFWARQKEKFGWRPYYLVVSSMDRREPLLVLTRMVFGPFHLCYVPHGPSARTLELINGKGNNAKDKEAHGLKLLARSIESVVNSRILAVRFEPLWLAQSDKELVDAFSLDIVDGDEASQLAAGKDRKLFDQWRKSCFKPHLFKAPGDIQPPDTVVIDISRGTDEILAGMRSKTRYNMRLAGKKDVVLKKLDEAKIEDWYSLYKETSVRDKISIHSLEYYKALLADNPTQVELLGAFHEDDFLAGIIVLYDKERATYVYGASSNVKRNLMPAYGLQWFAIERAKARNCTSYDMFGLPPWADPGHPMAGLYQFKTGFGARVSHYPGAWDYRVSRLTYFFYRVAESLRLYYYRVLKKK